MLSLGHVYTFPPYFLVMPNTLNTTLLSSALNGIELATSYVSVSRD